MDACNISGLNLQCHILSSKKRRGELARNVYSAFCTDGLRGWSHHTPECRETALPQAAWLSSRSPNSQLCRVRRESLFIGRPPQCMRGKCALAALLPFDMRSRAVTYIENPGIWLVTNTLARWLRHWGILDVLHVRHSVCLLMFCVILLLSSTPNSASCLHSWSWAICQHAWNCFFAGDRVSSH